MAIIKKYYKLYRVFPDPDYLYIDNTYSGTNYVHINKTGTPESTDLSYSFDKQTWTDIHTGGDITVPQSGKVYLRSSTGFSKDSSNYYRIGVEQTCNVGGHIASVFDYTNMSNFTAIPNFGCFQMFYKEYGTAQKIVEANIDFSGVAGIGEYGCGNMFGDNSSLTKAPNFLDVVNIDRCGCYGTFKNCTSLTTASDMSSVVTIGEAACATMFEGDTSLTTAADLSRVTSVGGRSGMDSNGGCNRMYYGCSSLVNGSDISNVTTAAYYAFNAMYDQSSSLNLAIAPNISSWNTGTFFNWLRGTASTGVVRKPASLTIPTDNNSGVPTGWTTTNY